MVGQYNGYGVSKIDYDNAYGSAFKILMNGNTYVLEINSVKNTGKIVPIRLIKAN